MLKVGKNDRVAGFDGDSGEETRAEHPPVPVFFLSDSAGITAETMGNALLIQFPNLRFERRLIPVISTVEDARRVVGILDAAMEGPVTPLAFGGSADRVSVLARFGLCRVHRSRCACWKSRMKSTPYSDPSGSYPFAGLYMSSSGVRRCVTRSPLALWSYRRDGAWGLRALREVGCAGVAEHGDHLETSRRVYRSAGQRGLPRQLITKAYAAPGPSR
jgi:Kinase/pyrophosphorylase